MRLRQNPNSINFLRVLASAPSVFFSGMKGIYDTSGDHVADEHRLIAVAWRETCDLSVRRVRFELVRWVQGGGGDAYSFNAFRKVSLRLPYVE